MQCKNCSFCARSRLLLDVSLLRFQLCMHLSSHACITVASPWLPHVRYFHQFISVNGYFTVRIFLGVCRRTDPLILHLKHRSAWRRIRRVDADPRCWLGERHSLMQSSQQLENSRSVDAHYITAKCVILCSAQIIGLCVCLRTWDVCCTQF